MTEAERLADFLRVLSPLDLLDLLKKASPQSFASYRLAGITLHYGDNAEVEFEPWRERLIHGLTTLHNNPNLYRSLFVASGIRTDESLRIENERRTTLATEQAVQEAAKSNTLAKEANQFAKEANSISRDANEIAKEANAKSETANRTANAAWRVSAVVAALLVIETLFLIAAYRRG